VDRPTGFPSTQRQPPLRRLGLLAAVAALAVLACVAMPASPAAAKAPIYTGIVDDGPFSSGNPLAFERAQAAGTSFIRVFASWRTIAPKAPLPKSFDPTDPNDPHYDWDRLDQLVNQTLAHNMAPVVNVSEAPAWAERCPDETPFPGYCNPDPKAVGQFATALSRRYAGRVFWWQVSNEPNLTEFLKPQRRHGRDVSPTLYRRYLNAFADAMHAHNPGSQVIAAGPSPHTALRSNLHPLTFLRELMCISAGRHPHRTCKDEVHADLFDAHLYTVGGPHHKPDNPNDTEMGNVAAIARDVRSANRLGTIAGGAYGNGRAHLWITEFSWDVNPPDPGGISRALQARWLAQSLYLMQRAGVRAAFWYELRDNSDPLVVPTLSAQAGLYSPGPTLAQDQPRPALRAFRFPFVALPRKRGVYVWGRTPLGQPGLVTVSLGGRSDRLKANRFGFFAALERGWPRRGSASASFSGLSSLHFKIKPPPVPPHVEPFGTARSARP